MWDISISGISFYYLINWFIIYSFFGWVWETCYVSIKEGEFVNRGFINGPLCTIYGCGAISVYLILKPLENNLPALFVGGIIVATFLEYFTAVLMESIFHTSWWDYSDNKFNFQGRICLGASLEWGLFTIVLFRVLQPVAEDIVALYSVTVGKIGVCLVGIVYLFDFTSSAAAAFHLRERIPEWEKALEEKQAELLVTLNSKMADWAENRGVSLGNMMERIEDAEILRAFEEKRQSLKQELSVELKAYKHSLAARIDGNTRRFVKSYPHLNRGYRLHHRRNTKTSKNE